MSLDKYKIKSFWSINWDQTEENNNRFSSLSPYSPGSMICAFSSLLVLWANDFLIFWSLVNSFLKSSGSLSPGLLVLCLLVSWFSISWSPGSLSPGLLVPWSHGFMLMLMLILLVAWLSDLLLFRSSESPDSVCVWPSRLLTVL